MDGDRPSCVPSRFFLGFRARVFAGGSARWAPLFDWIRPLAFWQKNRKIRPSSRNSIIRFALLIFVIAASLFSLRFAGWFDPLAIFNRAVTSIIFDFALFDLTNPRIIPFYISIIFLCIMLLEFFRPRFWCRHLCPFGALISLPARFSLLRRKVTNSCTSCGDCRRVCPHAGLWLLTRVKPDPWIAPYAWNVTPACPNQGIRFEISNPFQSNTGQPEESETTHFPVKKTGISRREAISPAGCRRRRVLAAAPLVALTAPNTGLVRPPGSLPEAQFVQTCITCQECVRICPGQALRPRPVGRRFDVNRNALSGSAAGCLLFCPPVAPSYARRFARLGPSVPSRRLR